ncbi:1-deoxy-D-xylulose-5-phosphate reductoisomerase [Carnobacterium divergens]|uniref:1-deoxy-D-xylulose-5-phosphate reductoisomerase n=1 Tax=Carnobacterium divergens TaxID=2748 RepID=UPI001071F415|nr:1-deoxy-D-xylulose-5-phosphate reductoisomerase [Carnobacterium divergens]TFJ40193.1 1-deoxy-D-xylulose-5-phosphate reductoisomerase [Carnobacterium divergens]TFJ48814.1 1-deoxy-D-xylulose-5-phosphate reductoisomerase [Carnobacterium divergens]TFJ54078.1 1-deoxy-D-xylulose-5-phosphate reductoisomerase [Carnobacterium divergens]TFJ59604.1 1-deoxy-D-xylulose-5-phosphate reductoisomerase [Carnobacterium divergens]TFJ70248.1 1-deoxy-D-xylulose-5-phosphate reductoisomerase [Carnobacterium diverg
MKNICLLGATGSVGENTVNVVLAHPEKFTIHTFSFFNNIQRGRQLIQLLKPKMVAVGTKDMAAQLKIEFPFVTFTYGVEGLSEIVAVEAIDLVLTAVSGSVGLLPTLTAIKERKQVAIANKETLVMAGQLVTDLATQYGVQLLPVDSEHSAIFQCLNGEKIVEVDHLLITASGGSFRNKTRQELVSVTLEDALNHPNWSMGQKITIDSATMMNKGLEVIEAHWLFGLDYDKIKVVLHKESVVHSMVSFVDGAVMAQLGASDMREPIQYALSYPNRIEMKKPKPFHLAEIGALHFEKMDFKRFPLLQLAYNVGEMGGTAPTMMNAANEVAVAAFLEKKISFLAIEELVEKAIQEKHYIKQPDLTTLMEVDKETRKLVASWLT